MASPNLSVTHITTSQRGKNETANSGFDQLDDATQKILDVSTTGSTGTITLASSDFNFAHVFKLTTGTTAAFNLDVQANNRVFAVDNQSGQTVTIRVSGSSGASISLLDGKRRILGNNSSDIFTLAPAHDDTTTGDLDGPKIIGFSIESATAAASTAGVLSLDYTNGPDFEHTLSQNVTNITVSSWPASGELGKISLGITQATTADFTVTFSTAWNWEAGTVPTMSTGSDAHDEFVAWTRDNGTNVYAAIVGQDFK